MIDKVCNEDLNEAIIGLEHLKEFQNQWKGSDKKIEDVWKSFRLIPLQPAYLIASHYHWDQWGWSLKTKWNLYDGFDQALHNNLNPQKIEASIASSIETQQKVVALMKVLWCLDNNSKTSQDAFQELKNTYPDLYIDLLQKNKLAAGCSINQIDGKIILKMIQLYYDGYRDVGDHFFKNP